MKVRSQIILLFSFVIVFPSSLFAGVMNCEQLRDRAKNDEINNAISQCQAGDSLKAAAREADEFQGALVPIENCEAQIAVSDAELQGVCTDLQGQVCNQDNKYAKAGTGIWLTDQCEITILEDSQTTPALVDEVCKIENEAKRGQETKVSYNNERISRVNGVFSKLKSGYLDHITNNKNLSLVQKNFLKQRIEDLKIDLPVPPLDSSLNKQTGEQMDWCTSFQPGDAPATNALFYNRMNNSFSFCIGFMINLEHMSEYDLMAAVAHEIGHALDPCMMEELGREDIKESTMPVMSCLEKKGVRLENDIEGVKAYAEWRNPSEGVHNFVQDHQHSHCAYGDFDPHYNRANLAEYKANGTHESQSGEAYADFVAGEVMAGVIKDDQPARKINQVKSIAAANARLHGVCMTQNTPDPHPVGGIRSNGLFMGSELFRDAVGCQKIPPKDGIVCSSQ